MNLGIPLTILGGGSALLAYAFIERAINQSRCPHCRFRVSADASEARCPRCHTQNRSPQSEATSTVSTSQESSLANAAEGNVQVTDRQRPEQDGHDTSSKQKGIPAPRVARITLIALPLLIITVDAGLVIHQSREPADDSAIRLVQDSSSRIENFTVRQYIDATLVERNGGSIKVDGWRAEKAPGPDGSIKVEFGFTDGILAHRAVWEVDLRTGKVVPANPDAWSLSWNY